MIDHVKTCFFYLIFSMGVIGWLLLGYAQATQEVINISAPIAPYYNK